MKYSILLLLVLMFSFSSCGNKEEVADNRSKVKVTVKQADSCFLGFGINFSGRIEPVKQSVVSTRLMGQVSRIFVKEGQPVNQGDLLISIRSNDLKARQNQIAATIDEVQAGRQNNVDTNNQKIELPKRADDPDRNKPLQNCKNSNAQDQQQ